MSAIDFNFIIGFRIAGEICCTQCIHGHEENRIAEDDVLTEMDRVQSMVFCDRCKLQVHVNRPAAFFRRSLALVKN
jgi:hypothetical protein